MLSTGMDYGVFYRNGLRCFLQEWIKVFSTGMDKVIVQTPPALFPLPHEEVVNTDNKSNHVSHQIIRKKSKQFKIASLLM